MRELTKSEQMMVDDGFPVELFISREQRAEWWALHPPKATAIVDEPKSGAKYTIEEVKKLLFAKPRGTRKTIMQRADHTGQRWDARSNRWRPNGTLALGNEKMGKWIVTCYNDDGDIIERQPMEEGLSQVEVFATMGAVFHRSPKSKDIKRILVTDSAEGLIREWEVGGAVLPEPDDDDELNQPKGGKKPKAKGGKKGAVKAVVAKGKKQQQSSSSSGGKAKAALNGSARPRGGGTRPTRGVGVIDTIIEIISRDKGASVNEALEILKKKFPDRDPKAMLGTARIQMNKNSKSKEKDDKRGMVYYGK